MSLIDNFITLAIYIFQICFAWFVIGLICLIGAILGIVLFYDCALDPITPQDSDPSSSVPTENPINQ